MDSDTRPWLEALAHKVIGEVSGGIRVGPITFGMVSPPRYKGLFTPDEVATFGQLGEFFELHATKKSMLAKQALRYIHSLYEIESKVRDLKPELRRGIRLEKAVPVMNMLHAWMLAQRDLAPEDSAISRALDYSLKRWAALSRYLDDGARIN